MRLDVAYGHVCIDRFILGQYKGNVAGFLEQHDHQAMAHLTHALKEDVQWTTWDEPDGIHHREARLIVLRPPFLPPRYVNALSSMVDTMDRTCPEDCRLTVDIVRGKEPIVTVETLRHKEIT